MRRYYIKVLGSDNKPCSASFQVKAKYCTLQNVCNNYATLPTWGDPIPTGGTRKYITGADGVARVDLPRDLADGYYFASVDLEGVSNPTWSNEVRITIKSDSSTSQNLINSGVIEKNINLADYYEINPGNTYIYTTVNNIYDKTGKSYLVLESPRKWGDFTVIPWRFTKDSRYAYWDAANFNRSGNKNTRWMVVDPTSNVNNLWSHVIWSVGTINYTLNTNPNISSLGSGFNNGYIFGTRDREIPPYDLGPKAFSLPYSTRYRSTTNHQYLSTQSYNPPRVGDVVNTRSSSGGDWKLLIERDTLPGYDDVIRIDFLEGEYPLETAGFHKETWYLAKGIGLVEQRQTFYNNYGGVSSGRYCTLDTECFNETTRENTHVYVKLDKYYIARKTTFNVNIATTNSSGSRVSNFSSNINVVKSLNQGYEFKITNSDYTGYLEVKSGQYLSKWLWVENGTVRVPNTLLNGVSQGTYKYRFRIWSPNDAFPNETVLSDSRVDAIPWSNEVTINVFDSSPNIISRGSFGDISSTSIWGWACDPDLGNNPSLVHLYYRVLGSGSNFSPLNIEDSNGNPLSSNLNLANSSFNDPGVINICGSANHGFSFPIPSAIKDGRTYEVKAYAIDKDSAGNLTSSHPEIGIKTYRYINQLPTVTLNTSQSSSTAPSNITLTATASDPDGSVTLVEFYNGSTKIGQATSNNNNNTFTYTWSNRPQGTYNLKARAKDNTGAFGNYSAIKTVTVLAAPTPTPTPTPNIAPKVDSITFDKGSYTEPANVVVTANVSDLNGNSTINRVDFYSNNSKVGTDNTSPYRVSMSGLSAGSYTIKAVVYDPTGLSGEKSVTLNVESASLDCDGRPSVFDFNDLIRALDYYFNGGTPPISCDKKGESGKIDYLDLIYLLDLFFN